MPEGDTIHRTARNLHAALAGKALTRFEAPRLAGRGPAPGTLVEGVEARGKHCLVRFGDGRVLRTHMRMTGSWHLYRPGERWRKQRGAARVVLEAGEGEGAWVAVCFAAPVVELLEPSAAAAGQGTAHLGPDLCRPDADLGEAARRLAALPPGTDAATALLDQRVAAGIGNVYKCEALFACGLHPATPVGDLDDDGRHRLLAIAARQLRANLASHDRTTVPGGGLGVYGRAGRPCRRCGARVQQAMLGHPPRVTYWCPGCQPPSAAPAPGPAAGRPAGSPPA